MTRSAQDNRDLHVPEPARPPAAGSVDRRPAWSKPELTAHGDLRELTMGLSPDPTESGGGGVNFHP